MQQRSSAAPSSRHRPAAPRALVLLSLLGTAPACGGGDERLAIVVTVENLPPQATALEVAARLNGRPDRTPSKAITEGLGRFVVYLPATSEGTLELEINALYGTSCYRDSALVSLDVHPAPPRVREVTAVMQASATERCPLTIALQGPGSVSSSPSGVECSAASCRGVFPRGTAVKLTATPGRRAAPEVIWSPSCGNTPPTCSVTVGGPTQLDLRFVELVCSPSGWCQHDAKVALRKLYGVWSNGPSDVWVVGDLNTVAHLDGKAWTSLTVPADPASTHYAVASSGPRDVVVAGELNGGGYLLAFDGTTWTQRATAAKPFRDVWIDSPTSGVAVGDSSQIYVRSGASWSGTSPSASGFVFYSVWGSASRVFTVATGGTIYTASPGSTMTQSVPSPTTQRLHAVHGTSDSDAWAVGLAGTLLRYSGGVWQNGPDSGTATDQTLYGLWGSGPADYWAVGDSATILRYQSGRWSAVSSSGLSPVQYRGVHGTSATSAWIVGDKGTVLQYIP